MFKTKTSGDVIGFFIHTVVVCAEGGNPELLLNRIMADGITPKQVQSVAFGILFTVSARHFRRLKKLRKGTGCRLYLVRKAGPLFLFRRLYRRRSLLFSALLFFLSLYLLSCLVWRIDTGSLQEQDAAIIRSMLYAEGIYPGCVANSDHLKLAEQNLLLKSDRFAYLKLNFSDGRIEVEANLKNNYIDINRSDTPLIAAFDGIIHDINIYEGYGMVKVNQSVSKGQLLVNNVRLTDDNEIATSKVYASITAYGKDSYTLIQPLSYSASVLTGETESLYVIRFLSLRIPLFSDSILNGDYQRNTTMKPISIFGLKLPITLERIELAETHMKEITLTSEQASLNAQHQIEQQLMQDYSYPIIISKKVISNESEDSIEVKVEYEFIANLIKN